MEPSEKSNSTSSKGKKKKTGFNTENLRPVCMLNVNEMKEDADDNCTERKSAKCANDDVILSEDDVSFLGKRKKKRNKNKGILDHIDENKDRSTQQDTEEKPGLEDEGDRDYEYGEMLSMVYTNLKLYHPEMVEAQKSIRAGHRQVVLLNFQEICRAMHRPAKHVLNYLLAEFGATGSVDMKNCLIIRGNFKPMQIQTVVSKYVREYVLCKECHKGNTLMLREGRLTFIQCETCGSRKTATQIETGYRAVTSRR